MPEPTAEQAFAYVIERLRTIFQFDFTSDIDVTLNYVDGMVKELQAEAKPPVGDDTLGMQHRYAALDAAIRILPEAKSVGLIVSSAETIEKFLSSSTKTDDSMPLTSE